MQGVERPLASLTRVYQAVADPSGSPYLGFLRDEARRVMQEMEDGVVDERHSLWLIDVLDAGLITASRLVEALEGHQAALGARLEAPSVEGEQDRLALVEALSTLGDQVASLRFWGTELLVYRAQIQQRIAPRD